MSGYNIYGLRDAKKICRGQIATMKGETDSYARGFRNAIRQVILAIDDEIKRLQAEQPK